MKRLIRIENTTHLVEYDDTEGFGIPNYMILENRLYKIKSLKHISLIPIQGYQYVEYTELNKSVYLNSDNILNG